VHARLRMKTRADGIAAKHPPTPIDPHMGRKFFRMLALFLLSGGIEKNSQRVGL